MRTLTLLLIAGALGLPAAGPAAAGPYSTSPKPPPGLPITTATSPGGRASWSQPWQYDSNGGNDRRPELPYYQQGGGQKTGGPARNLLPDDGLHFPR